MNARMHRLAAAATILAAILSARAKAADSPPALPDAVLGRWIATTTSATNYWSDAGQFRGSGAGTAQLYEFRPDGTYTYHLIMEIRTGSYVSRVSNVSEGTVKFAAHKFTLNPVRGHYHTESGSRITDRDMTADDLSGLAKTYAWKASHADDGKIRFVVPFDDGSKAEFRPAGPAAEKND